MLLSEAHGLPVAMSVFAANVSEVQVAPALLHSVRVRVPGRKGRHSRRVKTVAADKGFDSADFRSALRQRGIRSSVPERKRRGRRRQRGPHPKVHEASSRRYRVERLHAWMDHWRGLVVRYEVKSSHFRALAVLGAILICLRALLTW
jgi:transposase